MLKSFAVLHFVVVNLSNQGPLLPLPLTKPEILGSILCWQVSFNVKPALTIFNTLAGPFGFRIF